MANTAGSHAFHSMCSARDWEACAICATAAWSPRLEVAQSPASAPTLICHFA